MENENNKQFMRGFGGIDILENFPKRTSDEINPYTGISEDRKRIKLEIGLPKFSKDDISVSIDDQVISVYGSKVSDINKSSTMNKIEFKRSFRIPASIEPENISITHKEKILSLIMPKNNHMN